MEYHIENKAGDKIASFEHECDRDLCLDEMINYWGEDCELKKVDS